MTPKNKKEKRTKKEKAPPVKALTDKEKRFVEFYLQCWNKAKAAREAGYPAKSAREAGHELLTKPHISAFVVERMKELKITTDEIFARLSEESRSNIADFVEFVKVPVVDRKGIYRGERQVVQLKPDAVENFGHLIESIQPAPGGGYSVKMYSSQKAKEILTKVLGMIKPEYILASLDLTKLSDGQLKRIQDGEDIISVLLSGKGESDS